MPSVTSRQSRATKTGTFAPSSIMLSRKNLDSALEKTPPKPKSSARIETWRREVSQCLPTPIDTPSSTASLPAPILEHKKLSVWKRIVMKFSKAQKAQADAAREEEEFQRTGMWDEGSVRLGPGSDSSLDYGSGSWESELGEIAGFDRFAARRDRLWRAQKLLENSVDAASGETKGKQRAIPELPPIINPGRRDSVLPNNPSIVGT